MFGSVVNVGCGCKVGGKVIYVGRDHAKFGGDGLLGNRFRIGVDGDRAEVIRKFRRWLWERMQFGDEKVIAFLIGLSSENTLACHCAPQACHAEVIWKAAQWLQAKGV